ncbi:MAG TPA: zf-HC2 domain-containing protein [Candidatus Acidoferrales bacterium]|nr:zf-HC2 domain-containing protein [Candidatus Acidoferrales bacterium]
MLLRARQVGSCRALEARFEDYVAGRLEGGEAVDVEVHLRGCARCSAAVSNAAASRRLLRAAAAVEINASPGFVARVMGAITGEKQRLESWRPVEAAAWRLCWAATAAVLLLAAVLMKVQRSVPPVAATQQSQVQTLVNVTLPQPVGADDTVLLVAREDHVR